MYANLVDINILHYFTTIHNFCNRFIYWITKTYTHSEQYSFLKGINSTLCTALNTENYLLNKLISYSIVKLKIRNFVHMKLYNTVIFYFISTNSNTASDTFR